MSEEKLVAPGSVEYWERRFHQASQNGHEGRLRINELRQALDKAASFLESAATYQDRPGAMAEHEALAAELREVLVPPGVKALRGAPAEPAAPAHETTANRTQRNQEAPPVNPNTDNHPADHLEDRPPNGPITDRCGCNRPDATHQRGDAAFCQTTLKAVTG